MNMDFDALHQQERDAYVTYADLWDTQDADARDAAKAQWQAAKVALATAHQEAYNRTFHAPTAICDYCGQEYSLRGPNGEYQPDNKCPNVKCQWAADYDQYLLGEYDPERSIYHMPDSTKWVSGYGLSN